MYYVKTETEKHTITTSYVSEKQARQYGGEPFGAELHLQSDGISDFFVAPYDQADGFLDAGKVRTVYESKFVPRSEAMKFSLYIKNAEDRWTYSGLDFTSYSDANQTVKGPLSKIFQEMLILENADHDVCNIED